MKKLMLEVEVPDDFYSIDPIFVINYASDFDCPSRLIEPAEGLSERQKQYYESTMDKLRESIGELEKELRAREAQGEPVAEVVFREEFNGLFSTPTKNLWIRPLKSLNDSGLKAGDKLYAHSITDGSGRGMQMIDIALLREAIMGLVKDGRSASVNGVSEITDRVLARLLSTPPQSDAQESET